MISASPTVTCRFNPWFFWSVQIRFGTVAKVLSGTFGQDTGPLLRPPIAIETPSEGVIFSAAGSLRPQRLHRIHARSFARRKERGK